jgi:hypothetical protein
VAKAEELFGYRGWGYSQGFRWVCERLAAGAPAGEISRLAYYGPERVAAADAHRAR